MALKLADRVKETTTTAGSGTVTLLGAESGFQSFGSGVLNGNKTFYTIIDGSGWEVGIGQVATGASDTLTRDTILDSSNSNNALNLSGGAATVFSTYPADKSVHLDENGVLSKTVDISSETNLAATSGVALDGDTIKGVAATTSASGVALLSSGVVADDATVAMTPKALYDWTGSTKIATVGTIGAGTWQGTAIASGYIAAAATWNGKADSDTTYTAGTGLQLNGTVFDGKAATTSVTGVTILTNTINTDQNKSLTPKAVNDANYLTSHPSITTSGSSSNSGRTYVQSVTLDSNGHVTDIDTAAETVTDTTYTAGTGLELNGTVFNGRTATVSQSGVTSLSSGVAADDATVAMTPKVLYDWTGSTKIVTVGTVGAGTWQGTAIASGYIADASTWNSKADSDTTYTAGTGLELNGTVFNGRAATTSATGVTILSSTINTDEDKALTPKAVNDASYLTAHPSITTSGSSSNGGRTYVQSITLDSNGHVTDIDTAAETVTDTTYTAGTGLELNGTVFNGRTATIDATGVVKLTNTIDGTSGNAVTPHAVSGFAGSTNITTVGTVGAGTWQGTAIASGYIADANTWNGKQNAIAGAATTIVSSDLTASRAVVSNGSGKVAVSNVTSTELDLLDGGSTIDDTVTVASGDGMILNDGGTMKQVALQNVKEFVGGSDTTYTAGTGLELNGTVFNGRTATVSQTGVTLLSSGVPTDSATVAMTPKVLYDWVGSTKVTGVGTISNADAVWQGTAIASGYIAAAATWNGKQNALTFGIADDNAVEIDGSPNNGEYAKFTANGIEGRTTAETHADLGLHVATTSISGVTVLTNTVDTTATKALTPKGLNDKLPSANGTSEASKIVTLDADKDVAGIKMIGCSGIISCVDNHGVSPAASVVLDLAKSNFHMVEATGDITLSLNSATGLGQRFMVRIEQGPAGSRTATWWNNISWAGGSAPTLTTVAKKADLLGFVSTSGTGYFDGFIIGQSM
jgi:hypothetical protein